MAAGTTISSINDSLVDQKVIGALRYLLPMLKSFSYAVESAGKILNDVVYVPIATDPTAQSKTPGTALAANGTLAGTSVTLSNYYAAKWDAAEGAMGPGIFAGYWADKAVGAIYSVAKQVVDATLGLITAANFGDVAGTDKLVVAPADFGQSDLAQLWQIAGAKIKQREVSLGMNAAYAAALLGETNLALIFSNTGTNFVQSGIMPTLIGMNTWVYPGFPTTGNLGGAVIGRGALLVATAPPSPLAAAGEGNIVERRIITDPDSGISALYTMTADGDAGLVTGECGLLYGVAKGQDAVVRLVSA